MSGSNVNNIKWNRKDREPQDTIEKITYILRKLGIQYAIKKEHNDHMWYSVNIEIRQLPGFFSNGKGITKEYALASALGEMMERLQCGLLLDETFFANGNADIKGNQDIGKDYKIYNYNEGIDSDQLMLLQDFYERNPEYQKLEPYYNLMDKNYYLLPHKLIHYICGSNGTCAGNTKEEALCQGISELYERYVLRKIFFDDSFLEQVYTISYEAIYGFSKDLLDYIKSREYEICIKDLTAGNSVPVLGLLVFNKKRTKYSFSIGSDIEIDICLQRCITEMFQGEDFKFSFRHKMKEIWGRYSCKSVVWSDREKSHEYTKALVDKSGYLPIRFVLSEKERPDIPSVFKPIKTNKGAFEYHLSICNKNGWDVLIKDFSWSGFPSYRVYIPKISEAFYVPVDNWLKGIEDIKDIKKSWLELNTCNAERKAELIASIERVYSMERYRCNSVSANKLFGVIIDTDDIRYNYLRFFDELLYALYWETGKIDKAFEMLESAILSGDLQKRFMDNLSNALNSSEEIESMADKFVFPNCPECGGCGIQNVCRYNEYKRIFEYMQDAMKGK